MLTLYHGSSVKIEKIDFSLAHHKHSSHDNGGLGFWCTDSKELASKFGEHIFAFQVIESRMLKLPIQELRDMDKMGLERMDYVEQSVKWLIKGWKMVEVVEEVENPPYRQFIILDTSIVFRVLPYGV